MRHHATGAYGLQPAITNRKSTARPDDKVGENNISGRLDRLDFGTEVGVQRPQVQSFLAHDNALLIQKENKDFHFKKLIWRLIMNVEAALDAILEVCRFNCLQVNGVWRLAIAAVIRADAAPVRFWTKGLFANGPDLLLNSYPEGSKAPISRRGALRTPKCRAQVTDIFW